MKWYENAKTDEDIIISSRVRLARNLKKYPFSIKLTDKDAEAVLQDVKASVMNDRTPLGERFRYYDMKDISNDVKMELMEKHLISPDLVERKLPSAALVLDDDSVSVMINEEDHIRIQTFTAGDDIEAAYDLADKIDNIMEETLDYAFDDNYGFITACPTNIGTGLRASYMMHLPCLEKTGNIRKIIQSVGKYGITVRGIYGEGSEAIGSIYQISNQITLGKSEGEIIDILKKVGQMVKEQELKMRELLLKRDKNAFLDKIYRSYGVLANAKKISAKEAFNCLSDVREGYIAGVLDKAKPETPIYDIMVSIQPAVLQNRIGAELTPDKRDVMRAKYINKLFGN